VEGGYPGWVEMETLLVLRLGVHIMFMMIESSVDSFFDLLIFNGMDASVIFSLFAVMFRLASGDISTITQCERLPSVVGASKPDIISRALPPTR
jgi:uncharacterized membrane protein (DUF441 family)